MPARDQSGPMGEGPMTGRAAGICSGTENNQTQDNRPFYRLHRYWRFGANRRAAGGGFGRGGGRGFGFRNTTPGNPQESLKQRKEMLEQEPKSIKNQLKEE